MEKKTALVTGAGRGIGREIALELAKEGFYVIVNYAHSDAAATECVKLITEAGGEAEAVKFDVASFSEVESAAGELFKKLGHIDVLVNNAGITRDNLLIGMKEEEFDAVINTNLKGTFNTMRHFSKFMLKSKWGRIINIASISGITGNPGQANYSAAKAGVIGMTKAVAKELARKGITVNAIAPGYVQTEMTEAMNEKAREAILSQIPVGRGGTVEDIAAAVVFLASEKAGYITGQVIEVNGGLH